MVSNKDIILGLLIFILFYIFCTKNNNKKSIVPSKFILSTPDVSSNLIAFNKVLNTFGTINDYSNDSWINVDNLFYIKMSPNINYGGKMGEWASVVVSPIGGPRTFNYSGKIYFKYNPNLPASPSPSSITSLYVINNKTLNVPSSNAKILNTNYNLYNGNFRSKNDLQIYEICVFNNNNNIMIYDVYCQNKTDLINGYADYSLLDVSSYGDYNTNKGSGQALFTIVRKYPVIIPPDY